MNFNESKTKQNLAKSFAAECQAGARYQFMATQAQTENLDYIKTTMKMIAKNEMAHAKLFYDYILEKCGKECKVEFDADYPYVCPGLEISLKQEAEIELDEFENLYPEFARVAREEGFEDIAESFEIVAAVEKTHAGILNHLHKLYSKKSLYKNKCKTILRCSNCGHTAYQKEGWKTCPLCSLEEGYIQLDYNEIFQKSLGIEQTC